MFCFITFLIGLLLGIGIPSFVNMLNKKHEREWEELEETVKFPEQQPRKPF